APAARLRRPPSSSIPRSTPKLPPATPWAVARRRLRRARRAACGAPPRVATSRTLGGGTAGVWAGFLQARSDHAGGDDVIDRGAGDQAVPRAGERGREPGRETVPGLLRGDP